MAEIDFDHYGGGYGQSPQAAGRWQSMFNIAGAVSSLALIVGLGLWGYKLAMRDVTGIPVLQAQSQTLRVAPADPGGEMASNMGLSVTAVAAIGAVAAAPDQLLLAPAPIDLADEDGAGLGSVLPMTALDGAPSGLDPAAAAPAQADMASAGPEALDLAPVEIAPMDPAPLEAAPAAAAGLAPSEGLGELAASLAPDLTAEEADAVAAALADALGETAETAPGPRPRARPVDIDTTATGLAPAPASDPTAEAQAPALSEIDPASIPVGTRLVQIGAFDDREAAADEWGRMQTRFAELMAGKSMVVQEAQSGGRAFFRLRAHGFEGEDEARRFCAALLAEGASCIPVAQR